MKKSPRKGQPYQGWSFHLKVGPFRSYVVCAGESDTYLAGASPAAEGLPAPLHNEFCVACGNNCDEAQTVKYSSRNQMVNVIAPKCYRLWNADTLSQVVGHEC